MIELNAVKRSARHSFLVVVASIGLATGAVGGALAQGAKTLPQETLDIGDEPGRVSTEEAVISEGPYARQVVFFRSNEPPGTVVVHTSERFLYLIQGNNRALRYGIGVGRVGFTWAGTTRVVPKKEWPAWTPPPEAVARHGSAAARLGQQRAHRGLRLPGPVRGLIAFGGEGDQGLGVGTADLKQDEENERILQKVVAEGREELGPEQGREAPRHQQGRGHDHFRWFDRRPCGPNWLGAQRAPAMTVSTITGASDYRRE